jgi:hypothetical protein
MAGDEPVVITKEMAVTHADFFRSLPHALAGEQCTVDGTQVRLESADGTWRIELGPEGKRRIALLAVPATPVTMVFEGYSDTAREDSLQRFDRAFQRGGG